MGCCGGPPGRARRRLIPEGAARHGKPTPAAACGYLDRSIAPLVLHVQRAAAVGLQGRYPGLGTARERRAPGGPQLQAPPPARRLVVRRRGAERAGGYRPGGAPHAECAHDAPAARRRTRRRERSEEHTSELQSQSNLVCRLLLEKKNTHTRRRSARLTHGGACSTRNAPSPCSPARSPPF